MCPEHRTDQRKVEIAELILGVLRGFLVEWRNSGDAARFGAGFAGLLQALEREEAADG